MLNRSTIDKLIPILTRDVRRAMRLRVEGFPKSYFCSFLLRDVEWFNTWASSGSTYRRRSDRTRKVYCDIRVGTPSFDQTSEGGIKDNDEDLESTLHVTVPIDDRDYDGLRLALWRLTETKFREALTQYKDKEVALLHSPPPHPRMRSFVNVPPVVSVKYSRPENVDQEKWAAFCKRASLWMSRLPNVSQSWVDFDVSLETRMFVSTEKSLIVQHKQLYSLTGTFRKLTKEGFHLEQEFIINCSTAGELPDMRQFKRIALEKHAHLQKLVKARKIHSFSGPVLLMPGPAGLLFHEVVGHRLEGNRLLANGEGQTFKDQVGKRIIDVNVSIRDNPRLKRFEGKGCIGAYDFDDEGVAGKEASLIKDGVLCGFLTSRAPLPVEGYEPNGHSRNKSFQRPISRMSVTVIEASGGVSNDRLKELLIEEVKKQNKPFGMIVYETSGGETDTTSYDFQAFSGEISFATILYPNGREVCVRGVNFVGTPLQALSNIVAIGNQQELNNGFCGAESGFIPVSTISPAVLIRNLELQQKDEEQVPQYILPRPRRVQRP